MNFGRKSLSSWWPVKQILCWWFEKMQQSLCTVRWMHEILSLWCSKAFVLLYVGCMKSYLCLVVCFALEELYLAENMWSQFQIKSAKSWVCGVVCYIWLAQDSCICSASDCLLLRSQLLLLLLLLLGPSCLRALAASGYLRVHTCLSKTAAFPANYLLLVDL